jgi:hypothetical protein
MRRTVCARLWPRVREYAEQEYATLCAIRAREKDIKAGKWISTSEGRASMMKFC